MTSGTRTELKTFADLFCGIGGFRVGLERHGLRCVYSCEIDEHARRAYAANFWEEPEGRDIREVQEKDIPDHDVLCAGFPCQSFSVAGNRKGLQDERGRLIDDIFRIVRAKRPKVIMLENVRNLLKVNDGLAFAEVRFGIEQSGYKFYWQTMNASHYGIPQSRVRVYMTAFRNDCNDIGYVLAEKTMQLCSVNDVLMPSTVVPNLFVERDDIIWTGNELSGVAFKPVSIGYVNKGRQGERIYSKWGHAVTQSANGGGLGAKCGLYLIGGRVRKPSVEEARKLMTFPHDHKLSPVITQARKQLGNAVMPDMVSLVFRHIRRGNRMMKGEPL